MTKHNQYGSIDILLIPLVLATVLLVGAIGFGAWAFSSRQSYKDDTDQKVSAAVTAAQAAQSTADNKQFAEEEKQPLRTYNGPEAYGSLSLSFPKSWSAYIDDTGNGGALVNGYFFPSIVPALNDQNSVFSLRLQVVAQQYSQVVNNYTGQLQSGKLTATAYSLPKVPKAVGVELTGTLTGNQTGTMVILPVRDKTIEISTNGTQYLDDFNKYILPNATFSP